MGAIAVVLAVTAYRLYAVRDAIYPGHADKAFYFGVAENLADGRGAVVDYVWHFLVPHDDLTHFAFDYWLPLQAVAMAVGLRLSGGGLANALSVVVVLAAVFALATAIMARFLTEERWIPPVAAVVVILLPVVTSFSVDSESSVLYWAVGTLAFAAALYARARPRLWLVAGAFAGLAQLTRSDGLVVAGAIVLCALAWSPATVRLRRAGSAAAAYLAVLTPYAVFSVVKLGSPLPTASRAFPFLVTYEDLYRTPPLPGQEDVWSLGLRGNLDLRLDALVGRWSDVLGQNGPIVTTMLLLLAGIAIGGAWRGLRGAWWHSSWLLPMVYGLGLTVLHVVVTPVVSQTGGWAKSAPLLLPFLVTAALLGVARLSPRIGVRIGLVAFLLVPSLTQLASRTRHVIELNNSHGRAVAALIPILEEEADCVRGEVVVMTRVPWQLTAATGFRSVQIPNEPLSIILQEAERWGVTHVLPDARRPQLGDLAASTGDDGPFEPTSGPLHRLRSSRTEDCLDVG